MTTSTRVRSEMSMPSTLVEHGAKVAESSDMSMSKLLRELVHQFLRDGSDVQRPAPLQGTQFFIDPDVLQQAREKARKEYGMHLRDVIAYEVGKLTAS